MERRKLNQPIDPNPTTPSLPELPPEDVTAPETPAPTPQPSFLEQQLRTERAWKDERDNRSLPDKDKEWAEAIEQAKRKEIKEEPTAAVPTDTTHTTVNTPSTPRVVELDQKISDDTPVVESSDAEIAKLEAELAAKKAARANRAKAAESPIPEIPVAIKPDAPKEEAPKKPEKDTVKIAVQNNAANRIFTDNGSDEELNALSEMIDAEDTRSDEAKAESPSSDLVAIALCDQIGMRTKQQRLLNRFVNELSDENKHFNELEDANLRLSKINPKATATGGKNQIRLSGEAARLAVLSRTQGLYRIQLYNSGFWITIRPMQVVDASAFVHEVDADFRDLGRIVGGQFHLVLGVYLKHKVLEILPDLIVSSNLEDWDQPDVLGEAISYQDYDTILWGICCAMYRDGIGIGVHCTNPECRHIDNNQFVDLTKACYINPDVFNAEAMAWMANTRVSRSLSDCINYRNSILKSSKTIVVGEGSELRMRVPSLQTYAKDGIDLVGKMESAIYRTKNKKNDELMNQITFHMYKMLAPWIASIVYKNDDGTEAVIDDYDAICTAMEVEIENAEGTLYDKIEAYIRDTKCSMYCLTSLECPACHKKPNLNSDGVFPLDVEYLFFGLSCLKLEQTGIQL